MSERARAEVLGQGVVNLPEPFEFECGAIFPGLRISYETWGALDGDGDNAVLVVHALTGDAHAYSGGRPGARPGWWEGLIGPRKALDPERHFIVCANLIGSCYGTTGPSDADPRTGEPNGPDFPVVTTRDMARAQKRLLDHLGIGSLALALGGSLGAMVVWEFITEYPGFARKAMPIAGAPQTSAWVVAFNAVARRAIEQDPLWRGGGYCNGGPERGLALARQIAMITYRTGRLFEARFGRDRDAADPGRALDRSNRFQVTKYLDHQGDKLAGRFDARAYMALTGAMDLHDIARGRGGLDAAIGRIESEVVAVGIDTDVLFAPREMEDASGCLGRLGKRARYGEISSEFGHDSFLVEFGQLAALIAPLLEGRHP